MACRLAVSTLAILGIVLIGQPRAQPPGNPSRGFEGYWMGIDHVDGGDSRRSLVRGSDGMYSLAARDSVFSLCDGTDRGYASFNDGLVIGRGVMESAALTIQCFNNGSSVVVC